MLDYAQLSAGKFRKNFTRFNLVDSVSDIIDVMEFKAQELGIKLIKQFNFPGYERDTSNINLNDEFEIDIGFDNLRL